MHISKLNIRILFQKEKVTTDDIGNQLTEWEDYYSCFASADTKIGDEVFAAEQINIVETITFTLRYCTEIAAVNAEQFRIVLVDKIYNIRYIDDMNFSHKTIKIKAELERRRDEEMFN